MLLSFGILFWIHLSDYEAFLRVFGVTFGSGFSKFNLFSIVAYAFGEGLALIHTHVCKYTGVFYLYLIKSYAALMQIW